MPWWDGELGQGPHSFPHDLVGLVGETIQMDPKHLEISTEIAFAGTTDSTNLCKIILINRLCAGLILDKRLKLTIAFK